VASIIALNATSSSRRLCGGVAMAMTLEPLLVSARGPA
jgi:hypothetical protein